MVFPATSSLPPPFAVMRGWSKRKNRSTRERTNLKNYKTIQIRNIVSKKQRHSAVLHKKNVQT